MRKEHLGGTKRFKKQVEQRKMPSRPCYQGWPYGTVRSEFACYVPSTLNRTAPAYRTLVQFLKRTVPTYRTRTITKNAYRTSVPYFLAKIEAYHTVLTYRTAIRAFSYSHLVTLKSLAYKSASSIHIFSVGFSGFLPLYTKSQRNVRKVWGF